MGESALCYQGLVKALSIPRGLATICVADLILISDRNIFQLFWNGSFGKQRSFVKISFEYFLVEGQIMNRRFAHK